MSMKRRPFVKWPQVPSSGQCGAVTVYALVDPRDERVMYVGVTSDLLEKRLEGHLEKPTNSDVAAWFDVLASRGLKPVIRAICGAGNNWEASERGWIAWFRERGDLLNVDPGGLCRDKRGKLKKGWRGRPQKPLRNAKKGRSRKMSSDYEERVAKSGPVRVLVRNGVSVAPQTDSPIPVGLNQDAFRLGNQ